MPSEAERPSRNDIEQAIRKAFKAEWHNGRAIYSASIAVLALLSTPAAAPSPASLDDTMMLRREVWLRHGHDGLYGDDGEMQCGTCGIDFKRLPVPRLIELLSTQDLIRYEKQKPVASLDEAVRVGVAQIIAVGVSTDVPVMQISRNVLDALVTKGLLK